MHRRTFIRFAAGAPAALPGFRLLGFNPAELDQATLEALASAVLPSTLGSDGARRVAREFTAWLRDYHVGTEALHGYGTPELRRLGTSPSARWAEQLRSLETGSLDRHRKSFRSLTQAERRELVAAALGAGAPSRFPAPLQAPHVVLALLAWFYQSPEATDLCYQAAIGVRRCRPLSLNPDKPTPLGGDRR